MSASKFKDLEDEAKKVSIEKFFTTNRSLNASSEYEFCASKPTTSKADESENLDSMSHDDEDTNDSTSIIEILNTANDETKKNNENNKQKSAPIIDYFKKTNNKPNNETEENVASNNMTSEDYIECEKCKKKILVWEMPEHFDFHFALELSNLDKTTNSISVASNISNNNPVIKKANKRITSEQTDKNENTVTMSKKQKKTEQPSTSIKKIDNYFKKA